MKISNRAIYVAACAALLLSSSLLHAATIFSNLTTPNTQNGGIYIGDDLSNQYSAAGGAFSPSANFLVTSATAAIEAQYPQYHTVVDYAIYSNLNGAPGTLLTTIGSVTPLGFFTGGDYTATATSQFELQAGAEYWLVLTSPNFSYATWLAGGSPSEPTVITQDASLTTWKNSAPFFTNFQFEIDGTPVTATPEPGTACLTLATILIGIGLAGRHKFLAKPNSSAQIGDRLRV